MSIVLRALADSYLLGRQTSRKYRSAVYKVLSQISEFLGRPATADDLRRDAINRWLASLEETHKPDTIRTKRVIVGTLWRVAHEEGLAPPFAALRTCKVPKRDPESLTQEEIGRLLAHIDTVAGCFQRTSISRRVYFSSLYNAYYDTALRISDLRSIEADWIWPGGYLSMVQSKTQRSHKVRLRPETLRLIGQLLAGRKTGPIWGVLTERNFSRWQRKLFQAAGIRGTGKWIRRASASYVERDNPGMGWRHLGHSRPGLAERYYLDPKIVAPEPIVPPAIFPSGPLK